MTSNPAIETQRELTITRMFNAPRDLVFKAWTDPKHLAEWWGPKQFTNPVCEVDLRPGGALYIEMTGPDGIAHPTKGVFQEIVPPERLVFTTSAFEDETGTPRLQNVNTITFTERDGKTHMTLHVQVTHATPEMAGPLSGMKEGWTQSIDKLEDYLSKQKR